MSRDLNRKKITRWIFLLFLGIVPAGSGCQDATPVKTTILLAPKLAEQFTTNPDGFDRDFANQEITVAGLIRNKLEENPSQGKRYLILWGYENPENKSETVVRCEYIPEFENILPKGRLKLKGRVLPYNESKEGVVLADCKMIGFRKPYGDKKSEYQDKTADLNVED